jgi:hypothetical protein
MNSLCGTITGNGVSGSAQQVVYIGPAARWIPYNDGTRQGAIFQVLKAGVWVNQLEATESIT